MTNSLLIPMSEWGHDHASCLLYLETRFVDHDGYIDNRNMRCNSRLHREFTHRRSDVRAQALPSRNPFMSLLAGKEYPTRLKNTEQYKHDDWSIVEELEAFGFLTYEIEKFYPTEVMGNTICFVKLTEKGQKVAAALREYKAFNKPLKTFDWSAYERS